MEKEGLVRATQLFRKKKFKIGTLVTDRHQQIAKWVRETLTTTDHRYDIRHSSQLTRAVLVVIQQLHAPVDLVICGLENQHI